MKYAFILAFLLFTFLGNASESDPQAKIKDYLDQIKCTNCWAVMAEKEIILPLEYSKTGQTTRAIFAWYGKSNAWGFWPNSYHFSNLQKSYKLLFIEYDKTMETWTEVQELDLEESYIDFSVVEGWCNRGFMGTGSCTPPKIQRLRLGLGQEIQCDKSSGKGAICFEVEVEIRRNKDIGAVKGNILVNLTEQENVHNKNATNLILYY